MARLFVRHKVKDYATWRKGYDAFDATRKNMGMTDHGVYRAVDDENDVTVWHDFASVAEAKALLESDALKTAMADAGVVGAPTIWVTNPA